MSDESRAALTPFTQRIIIHSEWDHAEPLTIKILKKVPFLGIRAEDRWRQKRVAAEVSKTVRRLVRENQFDVLLYGGRYEVPGLKRLGIPIVVDCCDAHCARFLGEMHHAPLLKRPLIYLRYLLMKRSEIKMARMSKYVSFISDRDRKALLGPAAHTGILPQGVDFEYWKRFDGERIQNEIVFTGAMDYSPNDDAAQFLLREVLPQVRQEIPNVRASIVGRDPLPELMNVARDYSDVVVTGAVPDIRPYLERAEVYIAPLRFASGVQNKVLEAMAMELPVVTTAAVADGLVWDGVRAPVLVAKGAREIAERVVELLHDRQQRAYLGRKGREFVVKHCKWSRSAEIFEAMCVAAASEKSAQIEPSVHVEQCA